MSLLQTVTPEASDARWHGVTAAAISWRRSQQFRIHADVVLVSASRGTWPTNVWQLANLNTERGHQSQPKMRHGGISARQQVLISLTWQCWAVSSVWQCATLEVMIDDCRFLFCLPVPLTSPTDADSELPSHAMSTGPA